MRSATRMACKQRQRHRANVTDKQVIEQAWAVLHDAGYNHVGAAGVIGNAYQESSWDPAAVGSGGGGLWGFTASPKSLADLQAYARQAGKPWTDVSIQTAFLVRNSSSSDRTAVNKQPSPQAAAVWWMENWERPAVATENQAKREQGAVMAYEVITKTRLSAAARRVAAGVAGITNSSKNALSKLAVPDHGHDPPEHHQKTKATGGSMSHGGNVMRGHAHRMTGLAQKGAPVKRPALRPARLDNPHRKRRIPTHIIRPIRLPHYKRWKP